MLSIQYQVFTGYEVFCIAVYDIPQSPKNVIICLHCVQCSKSEAHIRVFRSSARSDSSQSTSYKDGQLKTIISEAKALIVDGETRYCVCHTGKISSVKHHIL